MPETPENIYQDLYEKYRFDMDNNGTDSIWHYTSAAGVQGIVSEHCKLHFWFTRSDFLNDASEGNHILKMFRIKADELLKSNKIGKDFYKAINIRKISNKQLIKYPLPSSENSYNNFGIDVVLCHAYICSFSLKEDSLDMWRYYSKGVGGYGLECYCQIFEEQLDYGNSKYDEKAMFSCMQGYKVIYDDSEKSNTLEEVIVSAYIIFENSEAPIEEKCKQTKNFMEFVLKTFQFRFKHSCFCSEKEYRFVFYLPIKKPKSLKNPLPEVKYRTQGEVLVPYIDLVVEDGKNYLQSVMISPYIKNKAICEVVNDYLLKNGYEINSKKSSLPIRKNF